MTEIQNTPERAEQAYLPEDPAQVEPLDPVMVAEVLEALALRQEALERAVDALHRRLGTTPKDGPWRGAPSAPSAGGSCSTSCGTGSTG